MRDELLDREQIDTLREARVLLEQWRHHYNTRRPTAHWVTDRRLQRQRRQQLYRWLLPRCRVRERVHDFNNSTASFSDILAPFLRLLPTSHTIELGIGK